MSVIPNILVDALLHFNLTLNSYFKTHCAETKLPKMCHCLNTYIGTFLFCAYLIAPTPILHTHPPTSVREGLNKSSVRECG